MSNPFDQFDAATPQGDSNPFDQFDAEKKKAPGSSPLRRIADIPLGLVKGIADLPGAAVGLADIPTNGLAGKAVDAVVNPMGEAADAVGIPGWVRPTQLSNTLGDLYSPEMKQAKQNVHEAFVRGEQNAADAGGGTLEKFIGGIAEGAPAFIKNPAAAVALATENYGGMKAIAKGTAKMLAPAAAKYGEAVKAGTMTQEAADAALANSAGRYSAVNEGLLTAGQNTQQVEHENPDASFADRAMQGVAGAITGGISRGVSKIPRLGDVEANMALRDVGSTAKTGLSGGRLAAAGKSAFSEGVLEELPQSMQEQVWQNLGTNKPWDSGLAEQAVSGLVAGGAMGGAMGALSAKPGAEKNDSPIVPIPKESINLVTDPDPLQERIDSLLGIGNKPMNDTERTQYAKDLESAFGEVVGHVSGKDGLEIPVTMEDYLRSQLASADITRDRPKAENAVEQSANRLQQLADEESTQQPDIAPPGMGIAAAPIIPVVGALSAAANLAVQTGAHASAVAQQAAAQAAQNTTPEGKAGTPAEAQPNATAPASGTLAGIAAMAPTTGGQTNAASPAQVAKEAPQADAPKAGATAAQATSQGQGIDLSNRTHAQLNYLTQHGKPGFKEAAVAELAKRGIEISAPKASADSESVPALKAGNSGNQAPKLGDFIEGPNGYRIRIDEHKKGSNQLDPVADAGALVYEVRKGSGDANPLTMVLNKDGKLVDKKSVMNADGSSNGTAFVPPGAVSRGQLVELLQARAKTETGSAERSSIDQKIKDLVTRYTNKPEAAPVKSEQPQQVKGAENGQAETEVLKQPGAVSNAAPVEDPIGWTRMTTVEREALVARAGWAGKIRGMNLGGVRVATQAWDAITEANRAKLIAGNQNTIKNEKPAAATVSKTESVSEQAPIKKDVAVDAGSDPDLNIEKRILFAADSIDKLRKVDVERVLAQGNIDRQKMAEYIKRKRPDLSGEVDDVMAELQPSVSQPKTDAAHEAKQDKAPASKPKPARNKIDPEKDSMFAAIAKAGGMDTDELLSNGIDSNDITYETSAKVKKDGQLGKKRRMPISFGFALPLHKKGGMSFDGMREAMQQYGYLPQDATKNDAIDLFKQELAGDPVYTAQAIEFRRDQDQEEFDKQMAKEQDRIDAELAAQEIAEDDAGFNELSLDEQSLASDFAEFAFGENGKQDDNATRAGMRALGFTEEEINDELAKNSRAQRESEEIAAGSGQEGGAGRDGNRAEDAQVRELGGQEGFDLAGQTNSQAAEEFAQQQTGENGAPTKAQADKERDAVPFSLGMQSQPKPQGVQTGLFTADGRVSVEAKPADTADAKIDKSDDWLAELFGDPQSAEDKAINESQLAQQAQDKADRVDAAIAMLTGEIEATNAVAAELAARKYKSNRKQIELVGDGPGKNGSMSISAINESRRRRSIEAAQNTTSAMKKAIEFISENPDDAFKQVLDMESAVTKQFNEGFFGKSAKIEDQLDMAVGSLIGASQYSGKGSAGRKLRMAAHAYFSDSAQEQPVTPAVQKEESPKIEAWHTAIPTEGLPLTDAQKANKPRAYETVTGIVATDAWDAITQTQRTGMIGLYAYVLPATNGRNGIARLFPDDQTPPAPWKLADQQVIRQGSMTREQGIQRLRDVLVREPIIGDEKAESHKKSPAAVDAKKEAGTDDGIRYSKASNKSWYYSQLAKAIEQAPDRVFTTGTQVKLWLAGNKSKVGIKDDEIQWTGINDYLDMQGKAKVSKADVLAYLNGNGVQVQEVMKGGHSKTFTEEDINEIIEEQRSQSELYKQQRPGDALDAIYDQAPALSEQQLRQQAIEVWRARNENRDTKLGETKYATYQLPGGTNYRELLLTLPVKNGEPTRYLVKDQSGKTLNSFDSYVNAEDFITRNDAFFSGLSIEQSGNKEIDKAYQSSHWDERNILAHIRMNDRVDADGNKVLFIEEVQSDWGQQGKKEGFDNEAAFDALIKQRDDARIAGLTRAEAIFQREIDDMGSRGGKGVPSAPFVTDTKAWLSLAIKRITAYAAENGYDKVAFINGEQSADRYDLSKQVEAVRVAIKPDTGMYMVFVTQKGDPNPQRVSDRDGVQTDKLADMIGKELAERAINDIANGNSANYSGLDLKVGGEGMKTFYNQIVPQVLSDVMKRVGGKAESVQIAKDFGGINSRTGMPRGASFSDKNRILEQTGFTITPEMREKVAGGLPLFSRNNAAQGQSFPRAQAESRIKSILGDKLGKVLIDSGIVTLVDTEQGLRNLNGAKYMVAWHGSPHDHNKFDSSKIGTGEGAQAYGYGLYFAGSRDVAEYYKETLTNRDAQGYANAHLNAKNLVDRFNGDAEWAAEVVSDQLRNTEQFDQNYGRLQKTLEFIKSGAYAKPLDNPGKLYQVELAPSEDEYLDWDKPLSEQSEFVQNALGISPDDAKRYADITERLNTLSWEKDGLDSKEWNALVDEAKSIRSKSDIALDGNDFYAKLKNELADKAAEGTSKSYYKDERWAKAASDYLHSIGIRGIRYLDGSSRSAGQGNSNYVIFSDDDVSITAKYAKENGGILGATLPDGRIVLVLENLNADNFDGVFKHEGVHSVLRETLGEETYQQLEKRFVTLMDMSIGKKERIRLTTGQGEQTKANGTSPGAVKEWFNKAIAAIPKNTKPADYVQEIMGYATEQYTNGAKQPNIITRWVESLLSALRTAIIRRLPFGKLKSWAVNNLQPQDLANLAIAGLKAKAQGQLQAQAFREWLDQVGGTSEKLQEGTFLDPSLPVNTSTNARMVVLDKPEGMAAPVVEDSGAGNIAGKDALSPADTAIYGMAAEGKSAEDILKFIGSASRNPFYRQLAKLLMKTGISPTITVGDGKGWKMNAGEGNKYAAGYNPTTNTVSLFRPASAERNMLHELMHAATLKALSGKGMAAAQMKALYNHVKKTGKLKGMYGMSDVDEFIAEAFSNPKFQAMLKQVSAAPVGGKPSSAWDWFVRVVRGILGLKQGADNALSKALEIGVGVMRENMEAATPDTQTGYAGARGSEMQERPSVRAVTGSMAEPAQSKVGAGGKTNAIAISDSVQASAIKAAQKVQDESNAFDLEEEIKSVSENGESDLSSLIANPKYWDAENEEFTDEGYKQVDLMNEQKARDNLSLLSITDISDLDSAYHEAQYAAMVSILDGMGIEYKDTSSNSSKYLEVGRFKLRFADHANTTRSVMAQVSNMDEVTSLINVAPGEYKFAEALDAVMRENMKATAEAGVTRYAEGQKQTDTTAFRKWFGDSKVVDANGKPMVVYHGTDSDFNVFSDSKPNFFSASKLYSTAYGKKTVPVYLSIEMPFDPANDGKARDIFNNEFRNDPLGRGAPVLKDGQSVPFQWADELFGFLYEREHIRENVEFDGIVVDEGHITGTYGEEGRKSWVPLDNYQIKSAIGNNGDFDPNNQDIRYNVSDDHWGVAEPSKMDDVIYALQDKHIDTKRVMQAIMGAGKKIKDSFNPYLQEELFHGRSAKGVKDFLDFELRPLLKQMQDAKVDMGDFEEYLWNRHAPERNAQIAKINPDMPDGGSGIETAKARAYLAGLSAEQRKTFEALAAKVEAMNRESQRVLIESGLEKQSTIDAWNNAYQHYVPLQREDVDSGHVGTGKGFSVRGSSTKRAMGSGRQVVDIIANLTMQRERNIVRAEKNRVSNALLGLAVQNPNPDFWKVDQAPKERVVEETAIYTVRDEAGKKLEEFTRMDEADRFARQHPGSDIEQTWGDRVKERVTPGFTSRDNVLLTRINGEDHYVIFNERDERAMRMATAMKNMDVDNLGRVLSLVGRATRYLSAINTQYNPVFGVINLIRDAQGALLNLSSTPLAGEQKRVMAYTKDALVGIYKDIRAHRAGLKPSSNWASLFEEFQREGGATGYRDQYANAEARAEAIKSELEQFKEGKAKQLTRGLFGWLSDYNETMENAVRLASYKAAIEKGMSKAQAASLAKNITVNFNRKGQMATQVGSLYAFFNASVQGTARIAGTLFDMKDGDIKTARLSKTGKKIVYGGIMLGSMQALLLAAAGFGDDEPPDFIKERNLILPIGDGKYLTLAMPLGYHVFPGIGRLATEFVLSGGKDPLKKIAAFGSMFAEALNPIGNSGFSLQTITPSVIDPLAALAENRDFTGKEIYQNDFNKLNPTPGFTRAKDTATAWSKAIAEGLNFITGGTDYKPGLFTPTPDQIDYLIGQVTGGVGREVGKVSQVVSATTTGEDLPIYKVPLVGRFVGDTQGKSGESAKFYNSLREINMHEAEYKGLIGDGKRQEAAEYLAENPAVKLIMLGNQSERAVKKLKEAKRNLIENDAPQEKVAAMEDQIAKSMKLFNDRVTKALAQ